jgi:hypothetical protein
MNLPTRPTKATDSRAKLFSGESVEVDAIPPKVLRALVSDCITRHIDPVGAGAAEGERAGGAGDLRSIIEAYTEEPDEAEGS